MTIHPIQCVTPDDGGHYFFGYYEKTPWSRDGRRILAGRAEVTGRRPAVGDALAVGVIDPSTRRFEALAQSGCWNWQQGCMLQWLGEDEVIYNDRREGRAVAVRRPGVGGGGGGAGGAFERVYDRPIYAVDPAGRYALSLSFARLARVRPGYGYVGLEEPCADASRPANDGIWRIDLDTGASELLLSVAEIASDVSMSHDGPGELHWVNHVQISRGGEHFAFLHRWGRPRAGGGAWWTTRLMAARADGGELHCLNDHGMVSHYDWIDATHLAAWSYRRGVGDRYFVYRLGTPGHVDAIGEAVFDCDGHCSFSPDGGLMLTDTYPDQRGDRRLLVWHRTREALVDLGRFYGPFPEDHETRCDLHPRWSRDGRAVCFDSMHEGRRAMYVAPVPDNLLTPRADPRPHRASPTRARKATAASRVAAAFAALLCAWFDANRLRYDARRRSSFVPQLNPHAAPAGRPASTRSDPETFADHAKLSPPPGPTDAEPRRALGLWFSGRNGRGSRDALDNRVR